VIVDLFAGASGWATGARGLVEGIVGVELDPQAAQTHRNAHGARSVIETDVRFVNPNRVSNGQWVEGLISSSPCQTFSRAGKMSGIPQVPNLVDAVALMGAGAPFKEAVATTGLSSADERTLMALETMRWIHALDAGGQKLAWVVMEQVPLVLPVFQAYEEVLRSRGFSTWTGQVNSVDFGVAQDRTRAVMLASRLRTVARPYIETPKLAIADVLDLSHIPADARLKTGSWGAGATRGRPLVDRSSPSPTLAFGKDSSGWEWVVEGAKTTYPLTTTDMALLQGFPADFPWAGPRTAVVRQISNAIPPPLAREILHAVT
jgi:DNA (cytosine-5)-methyltransferase 1